MKLSLNKQILIGAIAGVVFGLALGAANPSSDLRHWGIYISGLLGGVFVNLLKMILIPLVFTSITVGIANLRAHAQMSFVWKASLTYYMCTTALAVILGLIAVNIFRPGAGLDANALIDPEAAQAAASLTQLTLPQFIENFIHNLFVNPIAAMANGDVLPTVIFALLFGIALIVSGEKSRRILNLMNEGFDIIMLMVGWIMKIAPFGIAGLLAKLIATQDVAILMSLGKLVAVAIGATLVHGFIILPLIYMAVTGKSPIVFFKAMREALVTALSTSSSSATLPVTMRCVEDNLKVNKDVAGFVLPLGATINMDGTALYEAVAVLFAANLYGVELGMGQQLVVFFTAIVAAMGAPGIPSAGMVTLVMVLQAVGLPIEVIALLLPIDRPLDALRTMVNVEGDAIGAAVVDTLAQRDATPLSGK